jgi:hypothetical protein
MLLGSSNTTNDSSRHLGLAPVSTAMKPRAFYDTSFTDLSQLSSTLSGAITGTWLMDKTGY